MVSQSESITVVSIALNATSPFIELVLSLMLQLELIMRIVVLILQLAMELSMLPRI
ncbi:MAG: hypothetical protein NVS1B6_11630 [Steroidobacteraceae bacterium]